MREHLLPVRYESFKNSSHDKLGYSQGIRRNQAGLDNNIVMYLVGLSGVACKQFCHSDHHVRVAAADPAKLKFMDYLKAVLMPFRATQSQCFLAQAEYFYVSGYHASRYKEKALRG